MSDYQAAYKERWPSWQEAHAERYRARPLTAQDRQRIRQAVNQAKRLQIDQAHARADQACACKVCIAELKGAPARRHGMALYNNSKIRCRCPVCKQARKTTAAASRQRVRQAA